VTSTPQGATIMIDDQPTGQETPFTFRVYPGKHRVSLTGSSWGACNKPTRVKVSSGSLASVDCTGQRWSNQ
jgi:hypothetical protein